MLKCKKCFIGILLIIALLVFGLFFVFKTANGQTDRIIFSEIAWMGTTLSANDEWIELYNPSSVSISLDGWVLKTQDGSPEIVLIGTINANDYFLLERTDDTSALPVADQIYTGSLKNDGEILWLYDDSGVLVDTTDASNGWHGGDNSTKETMARNTDGNWANGPIGGTPRSQNLSFTNNNNTEENFNQPLNTTNNTQKFIKTKSVIISEFLPNPQEADSENEWIELFNTSEESVDLSNWYLDDMDGGSKEYQIPLGIIIAPQSYLIFSIKDTNIGLNNNADFVRLLYPDKTIAWEIDYTETTKGNISFAVFNNNWQWTDNPTPGNKNIASSVENNKTSGKLTNENQKIKIYNQTKEIKNINIENTQEFSAQISQNKNIKSPVFIFLIVGILSLTGGVGFIFIKNRFFSHTDQIN